MGTQKTIDVALLLSRKALEQALSADIHRAEPFASFPHRLTHEALVLEQHIREGRFQRSLALIAAFSSLLGGLEVTSEHYRGSYGVGIMYTPVFISPALLLSAVWAVFSRRMARVVLPVVSLITLVNGMTGFILHIRGIRRRPGGWRIPIFNISMGPPLFAPLLFGISGFLGLLASMLRREDDIIQVGQDGHPALPTLPAVMNLFPRPIRHESLVIEQEIREGRFQRAMAVSAALAAFFSGFEALYSHYKDDFSDKIEWTPIVLTPVLIFTGIGTIWSRTIARIFLPLSYALALLVGAIGFFYHVRGVLRRPGGMRLPLYNIVYGPPMFAPLLFAASGFLGVLASLLRRRNA